MSSEAKRGGSPQVLGRTTVGAETSLPGFALDPWTLVANAIEEPR
jgi:hypothetical protein